MTTPTSCPALVRGVRALLRAGRLDDARALAAVSDETDPSLCLVLVELDIAEAYLTGESPDPGSVERRRPVIEAHGTQADRWDLELLSARLEFIAQIFLPGTSLASMEGRDRRRVDDLRARVESLQRTSPDRRREGWADFYLGVVLDNLYGERHRAPVHYDRCLAAAEDTADDVLRYEALRHLGDHRNEDRHASAAREMWEDSAASAARAGAVSSTLSQLILLAELARDRGEVDGARLLAAEVARWSGSIGATRLRDQALALAGPAHG
ncbi:hypothetical protein [Nocardioides sp. zg-1228]|uniref:hypothetical protein n=1 Tax=Nocardioides sp. zg-1228 TaxID=2763008 RepID=UPI001642A424|nr:hypothetical protein [Nocardioides sp. zg-1228]MBC2932499.1 hypothetical protein [Nocardioides sp. zg-1228]QSF58003.1 hypothetical protein JX575_01880 [Nocardioides sp. zg-1228]